MDQLHLELRPVRRPGRCLWNMPEPWSLSMAHATLGVRKTWFWILIFPLRNCPQELWTWVNTETLWASLSSCVNAGSHFAGGETRVGHTGTWCTIQTARVEANLAAPAAGTGGWGVWWWLTGVVVVVGSSHHRSCSNIASHLWMFSVRWRTVTSCVWWVP